MHKTKHVNTKQLHISLYEKLTEQQNQGNTVDNNLLINRVLRRVQNSKLNITKISEFKKILTLLKLFITARITLIEPELEFFKKHALKSFFIHFFSTYHHVLHAFFTSNSTT